MENEDRKALKQNVASLPRDNDKEIEICGGAGEIGINVLKVAHWKTECQNYFNRYFKTSRTIVGPSDRDAIINTLSSVCSDSKGRGFVFKNYNIAKHMEFLGYTKGSLDAKLGVPVTSKSISYIAYIEEKNVIFICEKVSNSSKTHQYIKNISVMVKYFLTLYNNEIQESGVEVIGLLIREKEKQEELVECGFCRLFSPSYKDFESPTTFNYWWDAIETYEGWWNLANPKKRNKLFYNLAAEILCYMAVQEKGLPTLTDCQSQQFKQTYFLYNPQQMNIHFSDAKHIVIQGSYGSGKSLIGLKKLELIAKSLGQDEKIIYVNFDRKSKLHYLMEENVKQYTGISSRKVKRTNDIRDILDSPDQLIYVYHNCKGINLSDIFMETLRLKRVTSQIAKTNYHFVVEEYDGETLSYDEAAKITTFVKGHFMASNVILLAQPLMKNRSWNLGKIIYERETCLFHELENAFKVVKLEEVLRCSNKICRITKSTQNFVRNKNSVFKTQMNEPTYEQRQQPKENNLFKVSPSVPKSNCPDLGTPSQLETSRKGVSYLSNDSSKANKNLDRGTDLDQAFERSAPLQSSKKAKSKIVSKFGFLCEPKQGVDIEGIMPNLVEFSNGINLTADIAVMSLALVLKGIIDKNKATTVLHLPDEQPRILRSTIQLLTKLDKTFSCTQDVEEYLQKSKQSKMIFSSSIRHVNGMEFDHVVIVVSQSEYYLKYYLPQAISRCTFDLTFVLLPKEIMNIKKGSLINLSNIFSRKQDDKAKETIANMIEELKRESLLRQVVVVECKDCGKDYDCYSVLTETNNVQTFRLHTHSDQCKDYLAKYRELEEQPHLTSASAVADAAK